ncbi:LON peptidase substrate-binding domain-containing protein [Brevundimonas fluminis]|uniref:LON peptidase substrate-binding domain-containing protein n=1 Tax=Brevundimonas fluminis TaxID=2487274 RepID=UPI000F65630C|nr:LON peptidase substrate-binding domain-containing protein [Brevundimonas fluminis]
MAQGYVKAADLPQVIPVFPLAGAILLPRGQLPLNIFEPRYLNMIDDAMGADRLIGMVQPSGGAPSLPALSPVGCVGRITSFAETSDGRYLITLTGVSRWRLTSELPVQTPYRQIRADFTPYEADLTPDDGAEDVDDRAALLDSLHRWLERRGMDVDWDAARDAPAEALVNSLAMALPFEVAEKQALLEARTVADRLTALTAILSIDAADPDDDAQTTRQ